MDGALHPAVGRKVEGEQQGGEDCGNSEKTGQKGARMEEEEVTVEEQEEDLLGKGSSTMPLPWTLNWHLACAEAPPQLGKRLGFQAHNLPASTR